jgi:hypothetical protein
MGRFNVTRYTETQYVFNTCGKAIGAVLNRERFSVVSENLSLAMVFANGDAVVCFAIVRLFSFPNVFSNKEL